MQRNPMRSPASNAVQKPRKGPKEKAKNARIPGFTPANSNPRTQFSKSHDQLSAVSHTAIGRPVVPLVWLNRP
jgi:hypothetical protein